ncbi:MAG: DUF2840 domain-containing protein [Henriciella sp.]|nr:DUF2840 domain-containing protein [Henriciella sp.]MBO6696717.1 DUF2840 domain-containing protein [Henriciella sp.]
MSDELTIVLMAWRKRRTNHRLLFGKPIKQIRLDWQRSLAVFNPGDIFAYERWEANKFGTQFWSISIAQAGGVGDELIALAGVKPGAKLLAQRRGSDACKSFFSVLDMMREHQPLCRYQPAEWRVIGHRMNAGINPKYVLNDLKVTH